MYSCRVRFEPRRRSAASSQRTRHSCQWRASASFFSEVNDLYGHGVFLAVPVSLAYLCHAPVGCAANTWSPCCHYSTTKGQVDATLARRRVLTGTRKIPSRIPRGRRSVCLPVVHKRRSGYAQPIGIVVPPGVGIHPLRACGNIRRTRSTARPLLPRPIASLDLNCGHTPALRQNSCTSRSAPQCGPSPATPPNSATPRDRRWRA